MVMAGSMYNKILLRLTGHWCVKLTGPQVCFWWFRNANVIWESSLKIINHKKPWGTSDLLTYINPNFLNTAIQCEYCVKLNYMTKVSKAYGANLLENFALKQQNWRDLHQDKFNCIKWPEFYNTKVVNSYNFIALNNIKFIRLNQGKSMCYVLKAHKNLKSATPRPPVLVHILCLWSTRIKESQTLPRPTYPLLRI